MPKLRLPDGVELHWEERGEGVPVVLAAPCTSVPAGLAPLAGELARDHRVVLYDPRGTGQSTRTGPYDIPTDAEDLAHLLDELREPAVIVGFGDALHRGVEVSALRPALVKAVVSPGIAPLGSGRDYANVEDGLASSPAVVGALVKLFESDYRAGLRTAVEGGNPQMNAEQIQQRIDDIIANAPLEATLGRLRGWGTHDSRAPARRLGDRLWFLIFGGNLWFPAELDDVLRRDAPEARIEYVEDGAVSRPDLTAEVIRRITHC
ncbi:MAG TPA: alpha/beta hydrolase [Thermoleophilaceae bacterium]|nr:alpha/beta hydrolase [Thermoleophilaceae bacterium]